MKKKSKKEKTRNGGRSSGRLLRPGILLLFVICGLILISSCTSYNPAFYPSYDVLSPGEAVKKNPRGYFTIKDGEMVNLEWTGEIEDGEYIIIDENMSQWIGELKQEIKKLRGGN